jgi:hypothetical protein
MHTTTPSVLLKRAVLAEAVVSTACAVQALTTGAATGVAPTEVHRAHL